MTNHLNVEKYFNNKVLFFETKKFNDQRGFFSEIFNKKYFSEIGISMDLAQVNFSYSKYKNTVRGIHFTQNPMAQTKLVNVCSGKIYAIVLDVRKNSSTFGKYVSFILSKENFKQLIVPVGFAHAFCTLEDNTEIIYKTSNYYSPDNEVTILWNDKDLNIPWPINNKEVIISAKDSKGIKFRNFKDTLE